MVYVYGSRLYGKVDAVPGLGHVATKFAHFNYIPLFPTQGWLVISQTGNTWRGVRIPMSFKSVLMGWARPIGFVFGIIGAVLILVGLNSGRSGGGEVTPGLIMLLGGFGFFAFSKMYKGITRASYARACQLAQLAGMNEAGMRMIAEAYGQPPMTHGFEPVPMSAEGSNP